MTDSRWYLVCYDVRDPKRLRKVAKTLEGHGHRVQFSVFRCWLSALQLNRLRWELSEIMHAEDELLTIPICARCAQGVKGMGLDKNESVWQSKPSRTEIA